MAAQKGKKKVEVKKVARIKVTGFVPVKFQEFTISQKGSGRFEVVNAAGKNVNGEEKAKLLVSAKVLKGSFKKTVEAAAPAPEAQAEATM